MELEVEDVPVAVAVTVCVVVAVGAELFASADRFLVSESALNVST